MHTVSQFYHIITINLKNALLLDLLKNSIQVERAPLNDSRSSSYSYPRLQVHEQEVLYLLSTSYVLCVIVVEQRLITFYTLQVVVVSFQRVLIDFQQ